MNKAQKKKPLLERTSENIEAHIKEEWEDFLKAIKTGDLGHIDIMARRLYVKDLKIGKAAVDLAIALKNLTKSIVETPESGLDKDK